MCSFSDWIRFSRKKSCLFWVDRSSYAGFRLLPCHYTMKEGERGPFFPKLRVRIKDNNSSPHGKFHRFLFPFSCKFPDLNFASHVLYIYLCGTHSEPGLPVAYGDCIVKTSSHVRHMSYHMQRECDVFNLTLLLRINPYRNDQMRITMNVNIS